MMQTGILNAFLNGAQMSFVYDSANRLISAGGNTYTYNVEDVRVRNLCGESETTYAYNTNGRLSQLLVKTTDDVVTKYVYGIGLIGEETGSSFKTYHFDYRGSTAAITDINGNITDTFTYDTYGNLVSRTGTSEIIFLYNGRDGVVTDENGLIYMRARYYSPELRRFINADIIAGEISNAITLNRYAYANGNPVSNIDPFGLSAERGTFNTAVFIANFEYPGEGLPLLGHTQLYFLNNEGVWYKTEFTTSGGDTLKQLKKNAKVYFSFGTVPPIYDLTTNEFKDVKDINYVVLTGNFDKSVELAEKYYYENNFGDYDFFFNNCSNYTDTILQVADIDGFLTQKYLTSTPFISVPSIREAGASFSQNLDEALNYAINTAKKIGSFVSETAQNIWQNIKSLF